MEPRKDRLGKTPRIGDKVAYNPPYYKGLEIKTIEGFAKSGLPILGVDAAGIKITPKTGFVIVERSKDVPKKEYKITKVSVFCKLFVF